VVIVPLSTRAPELWRLRLRVEVHAIKTSYAVIPGIRRGVRTRSGTRRAIRWRGSAPPSPSTWAT